MERYSRQSRFTPIGGEGQGALGRSRALVVGCGALGTVLAETLVRAGVGTVRIVDRDFVELHNLQRQVLFTEADVAAGLPKAIAAREHLHAINSEVAIEAHVMDVDHRNVSALVDGVDVILDGTDNFEIRFLLNDVALSSGIPWVYGGCLGAEGQTMTIVPGQSACLRCLMRDGPPPPGTLPGCDVAGVIAPIVNIIASLQAAEALKILSGNRDAINAGLTVVDVWQNTFRQMDLSGLTATNDCPACHAQQFEWLEGRHATRSTVLCGRDSVQLRSDRDTSVDLQAIADRLAPTVSLTRNAYLLKLELGEFGLTLFHDGRAIVTGTDDVGVARGIYAKWIGS